MTALYTLNFTPLPAVCGYLLLDEEGYYIDEYNNNRDKRKAGCDQNASRKKK
jgi:hypothetical protein